MSIDPDHLSASLASLSVSTPPSRSITSRLSNETAKYRPRNSRDNRTSSPSSLLVRRRDASSHTAVSEEEDPFSSLLLSNTTLQRRSSHLSRWLVELQSQSGPSTPSDVADLADVEPVGTRCNPYLAYPHMTTVASPPTSDDAGNSHDCILDNEEARSEPADQPLRAKVSQDQSVPDTASPPSTIRLSNATSWCRNIHLSIRPASPSVSSSTSRSPSRLSMLHKSPRAESTSQASPARQHTRGCSAQASLSPASARSQRLETSTWRWRPTVLGHFQSASVPDTRLSPGDLSSDSRPSMCSTNTFFSNPTTATTIYEDGDSPLPSSTPSKASSIFGSLRSRAGRSVASLQPQTKHDARTSSSPSMWSQPGSSPHLPQPPGLSRALGRRASTLRLPFAMRSRSSQSNSTNHVLVEEPGDSHPHVLYSGRSSAPRMSLSSISSHSRKRKLVISGIAFNDVVRLEAVQRWCESFGEVDQITRISNGDLHVNFRKAEVADMVCRLRARVHIAGVGSVHMSWINGNKKS